MRSFSSDVQESDIIIMMMAMPIKRWCISVIMMIAFCGYAMNVFEGGERKRLGICLVWGGQLWVGCVAGGPVVVNIYMARKGVCNSRVKNTL